MFKLERISYPEAASFSIMTEFLLRVPDHKFVSSYPTTEVLFCEVLFRTSRFIIYVNCLTKGKMIRIL